MKRLLFSLFILACSFSTVAQIKTIVPPKIKLADSRDKVYRCIFANGNVLQIDKSFWNLKASKNNLNFYLFDSNGKPIKESLFTMDTAPFDGGLVENIQYFNNMVYLATYRKDDGKGYRFYSIDDKLNITLLADYGSGYSLYGDENVSIVSPDGNIILIGYSLFDKNMSYLGNCKTFGPEEWESIESTREQQRYIDNEGNIFFSSIYTPKEGKVNRFKGTKEAGWVVCKRNFKTGELLGFDIVPYYKGTTPQEKSVFVGNDGTHVYALIQGHTLVVLNEKTFELEKVIEIDWSALPKASDVKNLDQMLASNIKYVPNHGFLLTLSEYKVLSGSGYQELRKYGLSNLVLINSEGKFSDITTIGSGGSEGDNTYDHLEGMTDIRDGQLEFYCVKTQTNMDILASGEYATSSNIEKNGTKTSKVFQVKKDLASGKITYKEIVGVPLSGYSSYNGHFNETHGVLRGWDNGNIDHCFFKR